MVQVCMICLDTGSKLFLMSKYKLDEAYQHLVGHPLCDQGNLKQTLCVQCAQRLANFSRFRDKSLRARALMMELVEKHELITIRHMKSINRVKHQLISDIVKSVLEPDHSNVHIAHSDTDTLTELDATVEAVAVKHESCDSMLVDADHTQQVTVPSEEVSDADSFTGRPVVACKEEHLSDDSELSDTEQMSDALLTTAATCKQEVGEALAQSEQEMTFACTTCLMEFADEDMYNHHTMTHMEDNENPDCDSAADCSHTSVAPLLAGLAANHQNDVHPTHTNDELDILVCENNKTIVEVLSKSQVTKLQPDELLAETSNSIYRHTARENELINTKQSDANYGKREIKTSQGSVFSTSLGKYSEQEQYICDVCQKIYKRKVFLVNHIRSHTCAKILLTCKFCKYQCKHKSTLVSHMRTHADFKHFACKLCDYKCTRNSNLMQHMRTHIGIKPFACKLCDYKCTVNNRLVEHMRTHSGIKPFACKLCDYKCTANSNLVKHMRSHSGIKPFACKLCDYKCKVNSRLVEHMRTHSGIKPFACKLCDYKCTANSNLFKHMRTHSGIKPFACKLCDYKCTENSILVRHMRTHTGIKPFACKLCDYKSTVNSNLVKHMRTHTGVKPFACKLCDYKCAENNSLLKHMRTHTGIKPFACKLCDYKCTVNSSLLKHMRTHTGIKPFACELCDYKCAVNSSLVRHMRSHTGKKSFACKLCDYKCTVYCNLVQHIRTHTGIWK
ncbi:zinc finger protein ZFP2-like isoform X2 [Maniola hyperantus]